MRRAALLAAALLPACTSDVTRLERTLARQDSATAALGEWCRLRGIADPPAILAKRIADEDRPAPAEIRRLLEPEADEPIAYRHVRLSCGGTDLSIAHNWYRPALLTAEMNRTLDSSDTPFGRAVTAIGFTRERLTSRRGRTESCPPGTVLSHRAVLRLPDGRPFSALVECYTRANLGR